MERTDKAALDRSDEAQARGMRSFRRLADSLVAPHNLYAVIGLFFGFVFFVVTPPGGGPDEIVRFERVYEVATGQFTGAPGLPKGISEFTQTSLELSFGQEPYTRAEIQGLRDISLEKDEIIPYAEPARIALRIHHPIASMPYVPVMWAGLGLNLRPSIIFDLCKLLTLALGVLIMRRAIFIMPVRKGAMTFIALMPTPVFMLGVCNFDAILIACGFLFFALVVRHAARPDTPLARSDVVLLSLLALYIGVMKIPYTLVGLLVLLLPQSKFGSSTKKIGTVATTFLPGFLCALVWALIVKTQMVGDLAYNGPSGNYISPSDQFAAIVKDPLGFAQVMWRSLARYEIILASMMEATAFLGWNRVTIDKWAYVLSFVSVALLIFNSDRGPRAFTSPVAIAYQGALFMAIVITSLFFLYLQWTGVGRDLIAGFQGRYLLPIAPFILCWPPGRMQFLRSPDRQALLIVSVSAATLTAGVLAVSAYYRAPY